MTVLSICMNTANVQCNGFQTLIHFFLMSVKTPERVLKWASRAGLSLAPTTGHKMTDSLVKFHLKRTKEVMLEKPGMFLYDNLEFTFGSPEPTMTKAQTMRSVTSISFLPLMHVENEDLKCSQYVWDRNPINRLRIPHLMYKPAPLSDPFVTLDQSL